MKRVLYLSMLALSIMLTACEKDEIGGTATEELAGEWYVNVDLVDANNNVVYTDEEKFIVNTYNTAKNIPGEMYVDDLRNFWEFKVKTSVDGLTFKTNEPADNEYYDCKVNITEGKVLPKAATNPHGTKADSIVFYVSFSDDDNPTKYRISGYRYTGLASDD